MTRNKENELELMISSIKANNAGINTKILEAFRKIDRAIFIKQDSYLDMALHIAHGQTISQPSTIAKMLMMLKLSSKMEVLEVGTNTGYHACLTAFLIWPGQVTSIEIFPDLADAAIKNIKKLKKFVKVNVLVFSGDALDKKGKIWKKKYDRIYFTASIKRFQVKEVHEMALCLLNDKGLLLYPISEFIDGSGSLELWQKDINKSRNQLSLVRRVPGYIFVPLIRRDEIF